MTAATTKTMTPPTRETPPHGVDNALANEVAAALAHKLPPARSTALPVAKANKPAMNRSADMKAALRMDQVDGPKARAVHHDGVTAGAPSTL
jgi:hypothetical protein